MRLINVQQGTSEWLKWRRTKITASDAMSIMGTSPWKSILQLYEQKIFQFEQEDNRFKARGRDLEPLALQSFEEETGLIMFPVVIESTTINWMGASLDGLTIDQKAFVEIKCPGNKDHHFADVNKMVPAKYIPQLQHQIACSGLDFAYYYSFDGERGVIIEVKRDKEFIEKMIEKEKEFWHCLQTFTPPICQKKTRSKGNISYDSVTTIP